MAMTLSPLQQVYQLGQSIWYDNIRRGLITSGELQRLIDQDAVVGVTSNPTIFEKAIDGSTDYDGAIRELVSQGTTDPTQVFETLALQDIQAAADVLRPTYERTRWQDGYVSLEVTPEAANDTRRTIAEARGLWGRANRPNVMIKIPATPEGLPAIEQMIYEGINVNVTLIFSLDRYQEVTEAFIRGLEYRAQENQGVTGIASVASFFVSRVDTLVDSQLEQTLAAATDAQLRVELQTLMGTAATANARLAYQLYRQIFYGSRFAQLRAQGAAAQRCLWASTSTKNPRYSDVKYVEALIGPETVNTMPPQTIVAFQDHGHPEAHLGDDPAGAQEMMRRLAGVGIDMRAVTQQLEIEGVKSFGDSFSKLIETTRGKIARLQVAPVSSAAAPVSSAAQAGAQAAASNPATPNLAARQRVSLGTAQARVESALQRAEQERFVQRLWQRDPTLWQPRQPQRTGAAGSTPTGSDVSTTTSTSTEITNRLGWLTIADHMTGVIPQLERLRDDVRAAGFTHCVLLGMGGSSLAPAVLRAALGVAQGQPDLIVLDTTDPATIQTLQQSLPLTHTLFFVASKSGATLETISQFKYFYERVRQFAGDRAGGQFIAITDEGTKLDQVAAEYQFRGVFRNPPDIGGRYSALSYFGLAPAAILGIDLRTLLDRAETMKHACAPSVPATQNPGVTLGAVLATLAASGQNKATFAISPPLATFGAWLEQLLAESTGKEGHGIVPIVGETLGPPSAYGNDRLFIYLRTERGFDPMQDSAINALAAAGYPVVQLPIGDVYDLGQEFFLWEFATAIAAAFLGVNPFNQPNVQEAKVTTERLLADFTRTHLLPQPQAILQTETRNVSIVAQGELAMRLGGAISLQQALESILRETQPGDYVALLSYVPPTTESDSLLQHMRLRIRDTRRVATTLDDGPRYLHSVGQLHKGGPASGFFIQIVATDAVDVPIPGAAYTFGILKQAQALGDLRSLMEHNRRVIRIDLGANMLAALSELEQALDAAQFALQPQPQAYPQAYS